MTELASGQTGDSLTSFLTHLVYHFSGPINVLLRFALISVLGCRMVRSASCRTARLRSGFKRQYSSKAITATQGLPARSTSIASRSSFTRRMIWPKCARASVALTVRSVVAAPRLFADPIPCRPIRLSPLFAKQPLFACGLRSPNVSKRRAHRLGARSFLLPGSYHGNQQNHSHH